MYLSFQEICDNNGYEFESHFTTSDDGYILNLFRIPGRFGDTKTKNKSQRKSPVFFQHGIVDSADAFIVNTADRSLAFLAADAGYDVWLGNFRGNKYSRRHERLNPDIDAALFFDYSFVDMAIYDITAMLNYVKATTGKPKIAYVGHSMGTTVMFYMAVRYPMWVEQSISVFVALAPITMPTNSESTLIKSIAP